MKFIQRFWIIEITLFSIAFVGIGLALFNLWEGQQTAVSQPNNTSLVLETEAEPDFILFDEAEDEGEQSAPSEEADEAENDFNESDEEEGEDEEESEEYEPLTVAAALFGLDLEAVETQLLAGQTLAEIGAEQGVSPDQLTDALIAAETAFIQQLQQADELNAEEAQEWQAELDEWISFYINTSYLEPELIAARMLGLDAETLWQALESGQTIRSLAVANGLEADEIATAILASEATFVDQLQAAGLIEAEDAQEQLAEVDQLVMLMLDQPVSEWEEEKE